MKKLITAVFAIAFSFGIFAQNHIVITQEQWGNPPVPISDFGKVSFVTDSTWIISGNGITQTWSDAVQTDSCSNRISFSGGRTCGALIFEVDCRSNPDQRGDLFSWQAVYELREKLCPYPWRVPTKQDFINLDIALGGMGSRSENPTLRDRYLNDWGGTYGGFCVPIIGMLSSQGEMAGYWSRSGEVNINEEGVSTIRNAHYLFFSTRGVVNPSDISNKTLGKSLRCIRDN